MLLFVLCNPNENQNLAQLRTEFRRFLVKHYHILEDTVNLVLEWTKYEDTPYSFVEFVQFILDIFEVRKTSEIKEASNKDVSTAEVYFSHCRTQA